MKISPDGVSLIRRFAPLNHHAFRDNHGWVIGYQNRDLDIPGLRITPEMRVTQEQADEMMRARLGRVETCINACVAAKLTQNQFDALCSHVYWLPAFNMFTSGPLPELLNNGRFDDVAIELASDAYANPEWYGATRRRHHFEMKLFLREVP